MRFGVCLVMTLVHQWKGLNKQDAVSGGEARQVQVTALPANGTLAQTLSGMVDTEHLQRGWQECTGTLNGTDTLGIVRNPCVSSGDALGHRIPDRRIQNDCRQASVDVVYRVLSSAQHLRPGLLQCLSCKPASDSSGSVDKMDGAPTALCTCRTAY